MDVDDDDNDDGISNICPKDLHQNSNQASLENSRKYMYKINKKQFPQVQHYENL